MIRTVTKEMVYEVDLERVYVDDDPDEPVSWAAEWALAGSSSATEDNTEDLSELVGSIVNDAHNLARRRGCAVRIVWTLGGDAPSEGTIADAIAAEGVTLPERVLPA